MDKKMLVTVLGVVLVIVGLLGFVNNPELGLFKVDPLHNIIHILTGAVGIYMAMQKKTVLFGKVFAVVYALVTVLGFILHGNILGLMQFNTADNFLHLLLTAVFAYVGFVGEPATTKKA